MQPSSRPPAMAVAFAVMLSAPPLFAQTRTPVIGSPQAGVRRAGWPPEQILNRRNEPLNGATGAELDRDGLSRATVITTGPYDRRRYGFSSVRVHFIRRLPPEDDRSDLGSNAVLQLWVELTARGRASGWWSVPLNRIEPVGFSETGRGDVIRGPLTDDSATSDHVRTATADRGLPVLDVQWSAREIGMHSAVIRDHHLLLDLRATPPRLMAVLDDVKDEGWGRCGHDATPTREIGCRWEGADFRCTETLHRSHVEWADRRGSREFWLTSGEAVPFETTDTLERHILPDPEEGRAITLVGIGDVRVIASRKTRDHGFRLFAAPSLEPGFDVSLLMGVSRRTGEPNDPLGGETVAFTRRIDVRRLSLEPAPLVPQPGRATLGQFTPDGLDLPRFHVQPLVEADGDQRLTVLQLTVVEGLGRGVFLVGIEQRDETWTTDAIRIATDSEVPDDCFDRRFPRTAVGLSASSWPFAVQLDVEPANIEDQTSDELVFKRDDGEPACPVQTVITWTAGAGFVQSNSPTSCSASPKLRFVKIADDGGLGYQERPRKEGR